MRLRLLAAVASFALLAACSSKGGESPADDSSANPPDRATDTNGAAPAPAAPPADPGAPPPSSLGAGGDPDAGTEGGAGTGAGTGTGTGGGAGGGSLCVNGSVKEAEANNTADTANAMPGASGSFCGSLSAAGDVDFVAFTLPANATYLSFGSSFSRGGLSITVTANGKSFKVGETPAFEPGQKYVAKIETSGSVPADYRLEVEIKQ